MKVFLWIFKSQFYAVEVFTGLLNYEVRLNTWLGPLLGFRFRMLGSVSLSLAVYNFLTG